MDYIYLPLWLLLTLAFGGSALCALLLAREAELLPPRRTFWHVMALAFLGAWSFAFTQVVLIWGRL